MKYWLLPGIFGACLYLVAGAAATQIEKSHEETVKSRQAWQNTKGWFGYQLGRFKHWMPANEESNHQPFDFSSRQMVVVDVRDYGLGAPGKGVFRAQVNVRMADALRAALQDISQTSDYKIRTIGGMRNPHKRCHRGSMHPCGLAIDINPGQNPDCPSWGQNKEIGDHWGNVDKNTISATELSRCRRGKRVTDIPKEVVQAFENHGFYWGGNGWGETNRSDAMHFEYRRGL